MEAPDAGYLEQLVAEFDAVFQERLPSGERRFSAEEIDRLSPIVLLKVVSLAGWDALEASQVEELGGLLHVLGLDEGATEGQITSALSVYVRDVGHHPLLAALDEVMAKHGERLDQDRKAEAKEAYRKMTGEEASTAPHIEDEKPEGPSAQELELLAQGKIRL